MYSIQECCLISPGWTGSGGISGIELLAAAAFDVAVLLFVGEVGRIHSLGSTFVRKSPSLSTETTVLSGLSAGYLVWERYLLCTKF